MNWFQRYGIPGAYFLGLVAVWLHIFDRWSWLLNKSIDTQALPTGLVGFAALTFLPIGYLISILSQSMYLALGHKPPFKWLVWRGVHTAAVRDNKTRKILQGLQRHFKDGPEWEMEAAALILTTFSPTLRLEETSFTRNWFARRIDVMAINSSLFLATFLSFGPLSYVWQRSGNWPGPPAAWGGLVVAGAAMAVFAWSNHILHKEVVRAVRQVLLRASGGA